MILRTIDYSSATYYGNGGKDRTGKRGPKTSIDDEQLVKYIKETIEEIPFHGTGYKKIHKRLNRKKLEEGDSVSKNRVFRIMQLEDLLNKAPGGSGSSRVHDGKLITDAPNIMWGTDGKKFFTRSDGWCWLFDVIDHYNSEIIGYTVVKTGDRFEASRAVQNAITKRFGSLEKNVASGLQVRSDRGSQYISIYYKTTMKHYGIEPSYTWARSPQSNGMIERFHRTIDEQLFMLNDFKTIDEAEKAIHDFIDLYNEEWMLERVDHISPNEQMKLYYELNQKSA